jgi:cryptochrome
MFSEIPTTAEYFGLSSPSGHRLVRWYGGETQALKLLDKRLVAEERAFREGVILTNQARPDLLGPPTSQSTALRLGCISVRRSYIHLHIYNTAGTRNYIFCVFFFKHMTKKK